MTEKTWWLSFCNAERPLGEQFLGGAVVRGMGMVEACRAAGVIGCNPGGEVSGIEIPNDLALLIPTTHRDRLLTLEQCKEVDAMVGGRGNVIRGSGG